jgi:hypothetical protein
MKPFSAFIPDDVLDETPEQVPERNWGQSVWPRRYIRLSLSCRIPEFRAKATVPRRPAFHREIDTYSAGLSAALVGSAQCARTFDPAANGAARTLIPTRLRQLAR